MRLLVDTHTLIWWVSNNPRLSATAHDALTNPLNERLLSAAAAWEFQWLQMRRRIDVAVSLDEIMTRVPLTPLDIEFTLHRYSASLPPHHGDPFDRIMIAQAVRHDLVFLTCDENIRAYPVRTLW